MVMQLSIEHKRLLVELHCLLISDHDCPVLNRHNLSLFKSAADELSVELFHT